ncbi:hydrogen peroxide-inducible genes activator [Amphritea pacifica]|uniref:LysR family transcriptional regulator n=1 Tax=Amphritea pacifica TaxID=2811233 RepID=A0ABS2W2P9_9GAMM|nr:hydrogen peroxide-inducible genes activator [Amphritea pacifica]MBN0985984.1 LysR family transcriptional regulator [Amphritea pacifica]MBN1008184.1 LysR family transcriptional regulator [Amphritea pacifica]
MISTKQLLYALAVEKTLHFKKAAENCHISQSALSTALNELEKQLGVQIFERDNKKVLVTPQGADVLQRARSIMVQVNELQAIAENQQQPLSYPITVGVIPTIAPFLLPEVFPLLSTQYPHARLNIVEEQSHVLVDMVRRGEIDTAILAMPFPCDGLLTLEFWQEDFYWVALKGDKYTDQQEISSNELAQSHLMLLKEGHCLKDHALTACKLPAQTANHGFGATSLNTLIQMVKGRIGTTLIPQMALKQLTQQNQSLSAIHLQEPGPHRRIVFVIRPNYTRMNSIDALMALCKKALEGS